MFRASSRGKRKNASLMTCLPAKIRGVGGAREEDDNDGGGEDARPARECERDGEAAKICKNEEGRGSGGRAQREREARVEVGKEEEKMKVRTCGWMSIRLLVMAAGKGEEGVTRLGFLLIRPRRAGMRADFRRGAYPRLILYGRRLALCAGRANVTAIVERQCNL